MSGWTRAWWVVLAFIVGARAVQVGIGLDARTSADPVTTSGVTSAGFSRDIPGFDEYARAAYASSRPVTTAVLVLAVAVALRRSSRLTVVAGALGVLAALIGSPHWGSVVDAAAIGVLVAVAGRSSELALLRRSGPVVGAALPLAAWAGTGVGESSGALLALEPLSLWAAVAVLLLRAGTAQSSAGASPAEPSSRQGLVPGAAWAAVLAAGSLHLALFLDGSLRRVQGQILALGGPVVDPDTRTVTVAIAQFTGAQPPPSSHPAAAFLTDPAVVSTIVAAGAVLAAWFLRREHRLVLPGGALVAVGLLPWWPDAAETGATTAAPPVVRLLGFAVLGYVGLVRVRGSEPFGRNGTRVGS